jgi:hypothetical protein
MDRVDQLLTHAFDAALQALVGKGAILVPCDLGMGHHHLLSNDHSVDVTQGEAEVIQCIRVGLAPKRAHDGDGFVGELVRRQPVELVLE